MRICVFCGSSPGNDPAFVDAARATGEVLVEHDIELVYGGARVGLMGAVADAVLVAGGKTTGIMPRALVVREIAHQGLATLHIVDTMHERKTMMSDLSDGFIALPGGAGTLEEIFEQWTWAQLGIHQKPCGFLNVKGYFDPLSDMIGRSVSEGLHGPRVSVDARIRDRSATPACPVPSVPAAASQVGLPSTIALAPSAHNVGSGPFQSIQHSMR